MISPVNVAMHPIGFPRRSIHRTLGNFIDSHVMFNADRLLYRKSIALTHGFHLLMYGTFEQMYWTIFYASRCRYLKKYKKEKKYF